MLTHATEGRSEARAEGATEARTGGMRSGTIRNAAKQPEVRPQEPDARATRTSAPVFPFAAIAGQEEMRQALLMAAVDPAIGGVMIFGDRGTGKSTAVRGLAELLPLMQAVADCPYRCEPGSSASCTCGAAHGAAAAITLVATPVVDLPLGVTEDRVLGALDLERALSRGEKAFEPGLLAKANRGFLYVDEINLLDDHIVDLLLDVAASGVNTVEREGLSVRHPARFVLVGSGNPEEGELRPQLLDRFGLSVEVTTPTAIETRIAAVKRRTAFEADPVAFGEAWTRETERIRDRIVAARDGLGSVTVDDDAYEFAARLCIKLGTDGLRGELTLIRAGRAAAALAGEGSVGQIHLRTVAGMALRHRLRRDPLDESGSTVRIERALAELDEA